MKHLNSLMTFLYCLLVVFACIGGAGCSFYAGQPQFGIAIIILFIVLVLDFFNIIRLPKKNI